MKYFYRPHRGGLNEAMNQHRFFDTQEEMLEELCDSLNDYCIHVEPCDFVCMLYSEDPDYRIGWNNTYIINFKPFNEVKNQESYLRLLGNKFDHPCGCFAFYTQDYKDNWEEMYKEFMK